MLQFSSLAEASLSVNIFILIRLRTKIFPGKCTIDQPSRRANSKENRTPVQKLKNFDAGRSFYFRKNNGGSHERLFVIARAGTRIFLHAWPLRFMVY